MIAPLLADRQQRLESGIVSRSENGGQALVLRMACAPAYLNFFCEKRGVMRETGGQVFSFAHW